MEVETTIAWDQITRGFSLPELAQRWQESLPISSHPNSGNGVPSCAILRSACVPLAIFGERVERIIY
jgi:hypothetical protein